MISWQRKESSNTYPPNKEPTPPHCHKAVCKKTVRCTKNFIMCRFWERTKPPVCADFKKGLNYKGQFTVLACISARDFHDLNPKPLDRMTTTLSVYRFRERTKLQGSIYSLSLTAWTGTSWPPDDNYTSSAPLLSI